MQQRALDCLKLEHLKQEGFIIGDEFIRKTDYLIPVYYRTRGENVHYYTFNKIQFTDFVWCNHSSLSTKFYYDDPNKENKMWDI